MFKENFNVALELLRKAESLTEEGDKYRAVTYNNFACIFRRTKKLRSALSYLEKALEIEYNYLHYSDESVDDDRQRHLGHPQDPGGPSPHGKHQVQGKGDRQS